MKASARYFYWKVGAADGDPGLERIREEVLEEAGRLFDKTCDDLEKSIEQDDAQTTPRKPEVIH